MPPEPSTQTVRKRRSDGERSREAILRESARLATVVGIEGLSISRLAEAVGMSKSGLFAHFGSKQELQLATVEKATEIFTEQVLDPAETATTAIERLRQYGDLFLRHVEQKVYPGGCFFVAVVSELGMRPGPVREQALDAIEGWLDRLKAAITEAQAAGDIDPAEDPDQLTFELDSYLNFSNLRFVTTQDPEQIERGRSAFHARLAAAAPRSALANH